MNQRIINTINKSMNRRYVFPSNITTHLSSQFSSSATNEIDNKDTTTALNPPSVTLYQYAICPFCNINKALLNYADLKYKQVEVNPLSKAELKPWSGEYKKVPIAKIDDEQVNGSNDINHTLLRHPLVVQQLKTKWETSKVDNCDDNEMSLEQFTSSQEAMEWSEYAKEELAPILYPNICRSMSESFQAFGYVHTIENFTTTQKLMIRGLGSVAMYIAASKIKSKRNIADERKALGDALILWEEKGLDNGKKMYASGLSHPNLGDLYVFGVLHSVSGLRTHEEIIGRDGVVGEWYARMKKEATNC